MEYNIDNIYFKGEICLKFICYPRCSTCKKAKAWLDDKGFEYEERDIKEDNPKEKELSEWIKLSGLPVKRFFNTSGILYKSMGLSAKLPEMDEAGQIKLLASDGMLIKRPLLIGDGFVLVGFKESEWERGLL